MMALVSSVIPNASSVTTVHAATKVKLNKTKATLTVGNTVTLKVSGTSKKVTWKSSNSKVAKVSSKGVVTAKKKGSAKITATVDGKKYTCKVTVEKPSISDKSATITIGDTISLFMDETTQKVTWSSGDKSIAKVSKKGVVTGVSVGSTKIIATVGGKQYKCNITVESAYYASKTNITIQKGSSEIIEVTLRKGDAKASCEIEDSDIASTSWAEEWDEDTIQLTIKGLNVGTTKAVLTNDSNAEEIILNIKVTDSSDENDDDSEASNSENDSEISESNSVSDNIAVLKKYIKTYGMTNSSGNKFIRRSHDSYNAGIVYEASTDSLKFVLTDSDGTSAASMTMSSADNTSDLNYQTTLLIGGYAFTVSTTVDPFTYNGNKTYHFTFVNNASPLKESEIQDYSNANLALAFSEWQLLLMEQPEITLQEIGFLSY
jgi:hypothetical protein